MEYLLKNTFLILHQWVIDEFIKMGYNPSRLNIRRGRSNNEMGGFGAH